MDKTQNDDQAKQNKNTTQNTKQIINTDFIKKNLEVNPVAREGKIVTVCYKTSTVPLYTLLLILQIYMLRFEQMFG